MLIFRFDDPDAAIERLQAAGINVVDERRSLQPDRRMSVSQNASPNSSSAPPGSGACSRKGARLKAERGAENVFDFTLGNPEVEPPAAVLAALRRVVAGEPPAQPRLHAQRRLSRGARGHRPAHCAGRTGLPFTAEHILHDRGRGRRLQRRR